MSVQKKPKKIAAHLTQMQGEHMITVLGKPDDWNRKLDIPRDKWDDIPGLPRRESLVGIGASGDLRSPRKMHGLDNIIIAMDALVAEDKPKNGEPNGNAYHVAVHKMDHSEYPYLVVGPYTSGADIPHHFNENDLDKYCDQRQEL